MTENSFSVECDWIRLFVHIYVAGARAPFWEQMKKNGNTLVEAFGNRNVYSAFRHVERYEKCMSLLWKCKNIVSLLMEIAYAILIYFTAHAID